MKEPVESSTAGLDIQGDAPTPDQQRDQPASHEGIDPEDTQFEKVLTEMIEKEVARRFQSAKDKRWAALEKKYGDLSELSEQARALLSSQAGDTDSPGPDAEEIDFENRVKRLADLPGIRENEDAQALILRNQEADLAGYATLVETLLRLALGAEGEHSESQHASAATAVIPGGSDSPGDLEQAYQRRKSLLRPGDVNALTSLKREFRQKGLDIF